MVGFLIFGTLWFWLLVSVASISIIWILESALYGSRHNGGGLYSTLVIIGCVILYYFCGSKQDVEDFFVFIKDHPVLSLLRILIYIGIGLVWSVFKWYFFLQNTKEKLLKQIEYRKEEYPGNTKLNGPIHESDFPKAKDNKARIISWMSYWPFSAFWTLINEPVKKIFKFIYTKFEGVFTYMEKKVFSDIRTMKDEIDAKAKK
jgi:hypothetical protein